MFERLNEMIKESHSKTNIYLNFQLYSFHNVCSKVYMLAYLLDGALLVMAASKVLVRTASKVVSTRSYGVLAYLCTRA